MSGWITGKRCNYATVFVDHYSGYGYVYLQKTQSAAETLEAKKAFEAKAKTFGVTIENYHANNGIFACKAWKEACSESRQGYSYSGVNAHFQSGVAERRIRELQEMSRTNLILHMPIPGGQKQSTSTYGATVSEPQMIPTMKHPPKH